MDPGSGFGVDGLGVVKTGCVDGKADSFAQLAEEGCLVKSLGWFRRQAHGGQPAGGELSLSEC